MLTRLWGSTFPARVRLAATAVGSLAEVLPTTPTAERPALLEAAASDGVKAALFASTEEAARRGAFGVPTFFVDGEMFWGQDRLDWVRERLASAA